MSQDPESQDTLIIAQKKFGVQMFCFNLNIQGPGKELKITHFIEKKKSTFI